MLLIDFGATRYSVPFAAARQVLHQPVLAKLPHAPAAVLGLVNFAGEVHPVFDSAQMLGLAPFDAPYVVLLETSRGPAGVTASAIPANVKQMAADDLVPELDIEGVLVRPWSK